MYALSIYYPEYSILEHSFRGLRREVDTQLAFSNNIFIMY